MGLEFIGDVVKDKDETNRLGLAHSLGEDVDAA